MAISKPLGSTQDPVAREDDSAHSLAVEPSSFELPHERVIIREDARTGLRAVIALHSTRLGPAAGGVRRWQYVSLDAARTDALRLSEGMSLKNALAGIPFGGGKSVILADDQARPSTAQLRQFAGWLNELQGQYITAEDVGMGLPEVSQMARTSPYVSGLGAGGVGGDPSPYTAYGVFLGLRTAAELKFGSAQLQDVRIAVQGLGAVGMALCELLHEAGARLWVSDVNEQRVALAQNKFAAEVVAPDEVLVAPVDVLAPCALGGVITPQIADEMSAQVIAGAANNQLASQAVAQQLFARGILYAPDFVINAGGVISVMHEYMSQQGLLGSAPEHAADHWVGSRVAAISTRLRDIYRLSQAALGAGTVGGGQKGLGQDMEFIARSQAMSVINGVV